MCLGNGYYGMRGTYCEKTHDQAPLTLIAGLYDQQPHEEEELMPLPDVTPLSIAANGKQIAPLRTGISDYSRSLNVKNGLLTYAYRYCDESGEASLTVEQNRFISMSQKHLIAFETVIKSEGDFDLTLVSSINARVTVNGTQHTAEEERTAFKDDLLWYGGRAATAGTQFRTGLKIKVFVNGEEQQNVQHYTTERRIVSSTIRIKLAKGDELRIVRYAMHYTAHDAEWTGDNDTIISEVRRISQKSFSELLAESERAWETLWGRCDIAVNSMDSSENLKIRLAMYHMMIMCPWENDKASVAAKGLTGMGYAGHVFWDSEIFNLPFFSYTNQQAARNICTYRYHTLDGARRKAKEYGFEGAMYPWRTASITGDEQTQRYKNFSMDNTPRLVTCQDIEQHVICDVAYGVHSYGTVTADRDYMRKYGFEILFETAAFWASRLEYKAEKDRYEICQVTGPDEYKEFVDNDVFTNYMVAWNLKNAKEEAERLQKEDRETFDRLHQRLDLCKLIDEIGQKLPKLYLPSANRDGIIPQDDTYLTLQEIDVPKYKNSGINRLIYRDYTLNQISKLMVSKQADLIQLFVLMPQLFDRDTMIKNLDFYEKRCIHDSTLSLSAYATVAARLAETDMAYKFFKGALDTDFGETSTLCGEGIHAANCGGIWQTIVFGFMGIHAEGDTLRIKPCLPAAWENISLCLNWRGSMLKITVENGITTVVSTNGTVISVQEKDGVWNVSLSS